MSLALPTPLSFAEAHARVLAAVSPRPAVREPLERCLGRALREALVAQHPLPPFRNSAMDGWAVRAADLVAASGSAPVTLPVVAVVPAGRVAPRALAPGEAMRIMTGAALPEAADAVVPFEEGDRISDDAGAEHMRTAHSPRPGENVREAGADVAAGEAVLADGRELSPHDLALAGALGHEALLVGPAPRLAVLTTGDELLGIGEPLRPGAIRDSNRPTLAMLARAAGADVVASERLPDDPERVAAGIAAAFAAADVVITVGGVSEGDYDPVKLALADWGGIETWRVAMRPGRPQAFGATGGRVVFGLPGNPASAAVVFEVMVRPALRRWQGFAEVERPRIPVRMARPIVSRRGRVDFIRSTLSWRGESSWAEPAGAQVSGHLSPQSRMHALVIVPDDAEALAEGDPAEAIVLRLP